NTVDLSPRHAKAFRADLADTQEKRVLRLVWSGFGLASAPDLAIEVVVGLDRQGVTSDWDFAVRNPAGLVPQEIHFPIVPAIARQDNERLAVPHWMGEVAADPRKSLTAGQGRRLAWHYPGELSMQWMAWYRQDGPGLYVACDDTKARRKGMAVWSGTDKQVHLEVLHWPEQQAATGDRWTLGYHVCLGAFCGDWFTAAKRYRAWAIEQPWTRQSRLARGLVPPWVEDTALWVWNRGRSPQVLAPADTLRRELGLPVSVFWHWWHGCPYDTGFPEYLPPREGAEAFRRALAEAHRGGLHAMVYMNQRLWGMTTRSWTDENASRFAVKGPDGTIRPEVYNTFTRQPCASMCMGTSFWRAKYAGLAEQAWRDLGVDAIYMDQACSSLACHDPSHGHPLGGGTYWIEGFQALAADLRRRCGAPRPIALAGEGCGEAWLPHLDLMLTLQVSRERYAAIGDGWEPAPLFHAVYHPYAVLYGNYSSLTVPPYDDLWPREHAPKAPLALLDRKFSRQFALEQARAFVWGQQPTIANFLPSHLADRAEEIDYVMRLARTRRHALKYLAQGTMLRAPALDVPSIEIDFSRLSIYAGQGERVRAFRKTVPAAVCAAWRAPDGDVGIALASIADEPVQVAVRWAGQDDRGALPAPTHRIDATGRSRLDMPSAAGASWNLALPPRACWVLELGPVKP
ncbi:MAG: DUF6259 domain-containing protein, partial [Thermoguttaceae bacterium]|nr:DUF6259 domain-containing protein [Thermoguttaceae bacterium]